ncbi:MAG TPA: hypothetical protein PK796_08975, partial [Bacteroidales bacterium]|nr:hypothetical protein [Bacteroidales bacterium]
MASFMNRIYRAMPWIIILFTMWVIANINLKKDYGTGVIEADGKGYFSYLPAIFIYHDLNFGFFYDIERVKYYKENLYYNYIRVHNNHIFNKYYAGTALAMMPFYLIGHGMTLITGSDPDGYSYWYTLMVHLGALFYLFAGLIAIRKLLRAYGIRENFIAFTLGSIVFGTNLFYYTAVEFSMSHVYSFAFIAWFVYTVHLYFEKPKGSLIIISGVLLGIIALIRPVNLVILLSLPFIAGSREKFTAGLKELITFRLSTIAGILACGAIGGLQLLIYKLQTGSFFVYSYQGEGFNFLKPHIPEVLFSYRKGLFLYTPLLLFTLVGFRYLYKQSRFSAWWLAIFFIVLTYIISSWHMWFYGGSFSQRVYIDFYIFFAILLALAYQSIRPPSLQKAFITFTFVLVLFCQFQTYQYRHMIIHWSDMNKEKYWEVMFKLP